MKKQQKLLDLMSQTQGDLFQHNIKICLKCMLLLIRSYIKDKDESIVDYVPTKIGIRRPAWDQFSMIRIDNISVPQLYINLAGPHGAASVSDDNTILLDIYDLAVVKMTDNFVHYFEMCAIDTVHELRHVFQNNTHMFNKKRINWENYKKNHNRYSFEKDANLFANNVFNYIKSKIQELDQSIVCDIVDIFHQCSTLCGMSIESFALRGTSVELATNSFYNEVVEFLQRNDTECVKELIDATMANNEKLQRCAKILPFK